MRFSKLLRLWACLFFPFFACDDDTSDSVSASGEEAVAGED